MKRLFILLFVTLLVFGSVGNSVAAILTMDNGTAWQNFSTMDNGAVAEFAYSGYSGTFTSAYDALANITTWEFTDDTAGVLHSGEIYRASPMMLPNDPYDSNGTWSEMYQDGGWMAAIGGDWHETSFDGTTLQVTFSGTGSVVPIPGAIWLLGSGLVGLVGFRRKFRKK